MLIQSSEVLQKRAKQSVSNKRLVGAMTLVEVMIVISIAAILLGLAVPSFTAYARSQRVRTASNLLSSSLAEARLRAMNAGTTVVLCASNNGTTCMAGNNWSVGWLMFVDANNDQIPTAATIVQTQSRTPNGLNIVADGGLTNMLMYLPSGGVVTAGGFSLCAQQVALDKTRAITISQVGHARVRPMASLASVPACT